MDGLLPTGPFPSQARSMLHFLPSLHLCYLAWGRTHLAFRHSSLGHLSFQFVHVRFAVRSYRQSKARSMGQLSPDGPSQQSRACPAIAGSLEDRHELKPPGQTELARLSLPSTLSLWTLWERLRARLTSKRFFYMHFNMCMHVKVCWRAYPHCY